jgi:hypothetical protein
MSETVFVIPAEAGIQVLLLDSRLHGNDRECGMYDSIFYVIPMNKIPNSRQNSFSHLRMGASNLFEI